MSLFCKKKKKYNSNLPIKSDDSYERFINHIREFIYAMVAFINGMLSGILDGVNKDIKKGD